MKLLAYINDNISSKLSGRC